MQNCAGSCSWRAMNQHVTASAATSTRQWNLIPDTAVMQQRSHLRPSQRCRKDTALTAAPPWHCSGGTAARAMPLGIGGPPPAQTAAQPERCRCRLPGSKRLQRVRPRLQHERRAFHLLLLRRRRHGGHRRLVLPRLLEEEEARKQKSRCRAAVTCRQGSAGDVGGGGGGGAAAAGPADGGRVAAVAGTKRAIVLGHPGGGAATRRRARARAVASAVAAVAVEWRKPL